jgi:predicted Zn-dependent peptidase
VLLISKGVIRENLSNGLCLLLKRVDTTPVVSVVTYGKSGTLHDPDDLNGLTELIQRLYFQGSDKYPSHLAVNQAVIAVGGILSSSAFLDHTISYSVAPGNHLNQVLSVQADALQRPLLDEATIRAERDTLFGEGALRARSPAFRATELSHGLAYRKGRLGRLRMGPSEGLAQLSRADLVALHRNHFRPENVIVSVVGNFDVQPVLRVLSDSYSEVELGPPSRLPNPTEDPQNSPRFVEELCEGTKAQLRIGFAAPGEMGSDRYALEALCCLIDQGFLVRHFRDFPGQARLLEAVTASYALTGSSGLWTFHASLEQGGLLQTEQAIFEALDILRRELIPADELARAKNLLRTRFLANQQFMHRQAEALAHFEALGGYHLVDVYLGKLSAITVQDVQAVCERYLSFDKACVVQCRPESDVSAPSDLKSLYLAMEPAAGPGGPRPNVRWRKALGEVRVTRLSGGPNLVLQSTKKIPVIAIGAFYAGGRWDEKPEQAGWTQLCLNLTSGSAQARRIQALGCSLYPMVTRDYFGLALSCLPDDFKVAGKLFMNLLRRPAYAEETVRIEGQALAMAARGRQSSELRCLDLLLEALYGEHPMAGRRSAPHRSFRRRDTKPSCPGTGRSCDGIEWWFRRWATSTRKSWSTSSWRSGMANGPTRSRRPHRRRPCGRDATWKRRSPSRGVIRCLPTRRARQRRRNALG